MEPRLFLTVCLNPVLQKTVVLNGLNKGEVNRCRMLYEDASGKGVNVVRVLRDLKCAAELITQAGGWNKARFLSLAQKDRISLRIAPASAPIRFCYTLVDIKARTSTEIVEEAEPVSRSTELAIRRLFLQRIAQAHTLILSGTKAAGFSTDLYPWMVKTARQKRVCVVLDVRGSDLVRSLPFKPNVIKPNFSEFVSTFLPKMKASELSANNHLMRQVEKKMLVLNKQYGCAVILTRGRYPILYAAGGDIGSVSVPVIKPVNTTGSGDAFTAGFASFLSKGASLKKAIREGIRCSSLNAMNIRPGTIKNPEFVF